MNKFYINDIVGIEYGKLKLNGIVISICSAAAAALEFDADRINFWSDNFPAWTEGYIYRVWLKEPRKCISYDDFCNYYEVVDTANIKKIYEKMVDEVRVLSFVEDELTLLSESGSDLSEEFKSAVVEELGRKSL